MVVLVVVVVVVVVVVEIAMVGVFDMVVTAVIAVSLPLHSRLAESNLHSASCLHGFGLNAAHLSANDASTASFAASAIAAAAVLAASAPNPDLAPPAIDPM